MFREQFIAPRKCTAIVAAFLKTVAELLCNNGADAAADDFFAAAAEVLFAPLCKLAAAREDRARPDVEAFLRDLLHICWISFYFTCTETQYVWNFIGLTLF